MESPLIEAIQLMGSPLVEPVQQRNIASVAATGCSERGPELCLRSARQWLGGENCELTSICDGAPSAMLTLAPLAVHLPPHMVDFLEWLQLLPDAVFLEHTSTSPRHEAPHYVSGAPLLNAASRQ